MKASERYFQTLQSYQQSLQVAPITLSSYCKAHHVYYRGMTKWMEKNGLTIRQLKESLNSSPTSEKGASVSPPPPMQQIYPLSFQSANTKKTRIKEDVLSCIKGVSITFPDGVIVCMKEISRHDLTHFIVCYNTH